MDCSICGKATETWYDKQFDLDYHYCSHCGFIAQDRGSLVDFDRERAEYDLHENSIENQGYVDYFKRFLDSAVMPFIDKGVGLDYGSGPEPVLSQVMKRDYNLIPDIYDLHYQPIKVYEGKVYDYIVSTEVIEHISEPLDTLRLFSEHLKPGGIAALMTLFHDENQQHFMDWWYRRDITHISFFTPRTFEYMAQQVGMEVIYTNDSRYITLKKN